jgi:hypothetical protein
MSDNNEDFYRGNGDAATGRELRTFFLMLLADPGALRKYYDRGEEGGEEEMSPRSKLIDAQRWETDAGRLLKEGTLKEIEEHILAIEGSYAKPLSIVWSL